MAIVDLPSLEHGTRAEPSEALPANLWARHDAVRAQAEGCMAGQWVLRGASCATPRSHARPTYRSFFPSDARWQFAGIRMAGSGPAGVAKGRA